MSPEEISKIARIATEFGIRNIKITGGEPLLRKDLTEIVHSLSGIQGVSEVSLVTNATLLSYNKASELKKHGLSRLNISLPSISDQTYRRVTGGQLKDAVAGVRAAIKAHLAPTKINMVILRGLNENEVEFMIDFAKEIGAILQLIELEPVNLDGEYYKSFHCTLDELEGKIAGKASSVQVRRLMQSRKIYSVDDTSVEVVRPVENTEFCIHCTRIRLTSSGKLKPCLMRNDNLVDILTPLRKGLPDSSLREIFEKAIKLREPYYKFPSRNLEKPRVES